MGTFSEALEHLKANTFVKREVIKNDTVIVNYKNRLYQMSMNTGVRYPYVPTNKDLMADDWLAWYDRRKNITGSNKVYSKIMLNGLVEDFYSVNDYLQSKLTELEQENERLRDFHKKATTIATSFSRLDKNTLGYKFYLRHKELTNKTNK